MDYSQLEKDWKTSFSLPGFDHLIKWLLGRLLEWEEPRVKLWVCWRRDSRRRRGSRKGGRKGKAYTWQDSILGCLVCP